MINIRKIIKDQGLRLTSEIASVTLSFLSFSSFFRVDKRNEKYDTCKSPLYVLKWGPGVFTSFFRWIPGALALSGTEPDASSDSCS